jgi:hypothetical protein
MKQRLEAQTRVKRQDDFMGNSIKSFFFLPALPLKLGMKQRLERQTRHERRSDFMDNCIILNLFFLPALPLIHIAAPKKQKEHRKKRETQSKRVEREKKEIFAVREEQN